MSSSDDITDRADALTAKEQEVGGPDVLIAALVRGQKRQGRVVFGLIISVILDIILSIVLLVVLVTTNNTANTSNDTADLANQNTVAIQAIQKTQALDAWNQCQKSRINTQKINATNAATEALLKSFPQSPDPSAKAALAQLFAIYDNAVLDVPVCGPQPS